MTVELTFEELRAVLRALDEGNHDVNILESQLANDLII